jgi:fructose-specific phosphotransferase system IIA component
LITVASGQSMKLSEYLRQDLIQADLRPASKAECLRMLIDMVAAAGVVRDAEDSLERLIERERVVSTGIGNGVAIPHAKTANVKDLVIGVARVAAGLDFDALDGQPVHVLFLLLGPQEAASQHVRLLARIARLVKSEGFLDRLKAASSAEAIYQLIREEDDRQP